MKNRSVLLTGATGIMGSWVLGEALVRGYRPVALMRDDTEDQARERLFALLELIGCEELLDKVRIVKGDAQKTGLGIDAATTEELRGSLGAMIHCAACTSFSDRDDETIWSTNLLGVQHVLRFLENTDIPLFHVSTAYVAGKRNGLALESELDVNQAFNNTYEQSKCEAEGLVREVFRDGRLRGAIFRPSIIVGASRDGRISQFMNFYHFLRAVDIIQDRAKPGQQLRVVGNPLATKNIIPVDWTAKALWHIVEAEGASGHVYHLTNPSPIQIRDMEIWTNDRIKEMGSSVSLVDDIEGETCALENAFTIAFKHYRNYLMHEPQFDRTNTDRALGGQLPFPEITRETFSMLSDYARERRWQSVFAARAREKAARITPFAVAAKRKTASGGRVTFEPAIGNPAEQSAYA